MIVEDLNAFELVESSHVTLSTCTLVCRAWLNQCRKHLFKLVTSRRSRHLKALAFAPSVVHFYVSRVAAHEEPHETPFVHLLPKALSTKIPHLQNLSLGTYADEIVASPTNPEGSQKRTFYYHPSFTLYLTQFRALRTLTLLNFHFPSFLDVRCIVGTLRSLFGLF